MSELIEISGSSTPAGSFQMQSWSHVDGERGWVPMENGAASKVWRPVPSVEAAVRHCMEWTGSVSIPAMRVVDLRDGRVAWQDSTQYPEAGASLLPAWAAAIAEAVQLESRTRAVVEAAIDEYVPARRSAAEEAETLREMVGAVGARVPAAVGDGALFEMGDWDV